MSQKAENLLNLALNATPEEREKSLNLEVGYNRSDSTWDVIVKYHGDIEAIEIDGVRAVALMGGYGVLTVEQAVIDRLIELPQIEYVEKPKRLFFQAYKGISVSCINAVQNPPYSLSGKGAITAVIDSGVDISHMDFRHSNGNTRIIGLWDQTLEDLQYPPPQGYYLGSYYNEDSINTLLRENSSQLGNLPGQDISGHGTAVLGIAAGNGNQSNGYQRGVAPESDIMVVKLGYPRGDGFPRTTELIQAVNFVVEQAMALELPVAINLSFGNTYGAHDGTSLLETYLNNVAGVWKNVIVIGAGNEGSAAGHTFGVMTQGVPMDNLLAVSSYETTINVQVWKNYFDTADIELVAPGGTTVGPFQQILGPQRFVTEGTEILLYYGEASPYSTLQEIYIDFIPVNNYITDGLWNIRLIPRRIIDGQYHLWLPTYGVLNQQTRFLYPRPENTLTIPSTASRAITVGAYDGNTDTYADFSGRGPNGFVPVNKPDLVAPGVGITTTRVGGGYQQVTGTSFATPFVTGSAALLMEYGITQKNDLFLYGEKIKAYLRKGARQLPGFDEYPNSQVGWGALCVRDSLPV